MKTLFFTRTGVFVLLVLAIALGATFSVARAAVTIQVTTTANTSSVDGACSLREAITATNTNTTVNECVHDGSSGADTITFAIPNTDTGCSAADVCTITLGATLPAVDDEVTIDGSAQDITVSGNNTVRVMAVNSGKTLAVQALSIVNGFNIEGGGIYNNGGTLNINNSTFAGNNANDGGAIHIPATGTVKVTNSTFTGNNASRCTAIASKFHPKIQV